MPTILDTDVNENEDLEGKQTGVHVGKKRQMKSAKVEEIKSEKKEWLSAAWKGVKPWSAFVTCNKFSKPQSISDVGKRLVTNIRFYWWNYIFITLFLMIFCIITSPMLLLALCATAAGCYWINTRCKGEKTKFCGHEFDKTEQYGLVCLITLPLYIFASAGSTIFWLTGLVAFIVFFHATFTLSEDEILPPPGTEMV
ncbi:Prenylated Rab acceptor protein 1 [Trichoplax sp. H2]|nr:Prenylated Rab acceptor protein 1 [Trichoplax sp. H2]|eukprot:RDD44497.1 Prenylated Rab acceptor protein 1 [Trichoplax sp. H2]